MLVSLVQNMPIVVTQATEVENRLGFEQTNIVVDCLIYFSLERLERGDTGIRINGERQERGLFSVLNPGHCQLL